MNKYLRFRSHLVPLVLSGEKTATWRLFDDKDLSIGDVVDFLEYGTNRRFAVAKITKISEKKFGELDDTDWEGHEKFNSSDEMYATFSLYYNQPVEPDSVVKMIEFELVGKEDQ